MDVNDIITVLIGAAGVTGGFFGGKRMGTSQASQISVNTVELLQVAVTELERQGRLKDEELGELRGRIATLESLVTQRAEVEEVRAIVDKIATKVGA